MHSAQHSLQSIYSILFHPTHSMHPTPCTPQHQPGPGQDAPVGARGGGGRERSHSADEGGHADGRDEPQDRCDPLSTPQLEFESHFIHIILTISQSHHTYIHSTSHLPSYHLTTSTGGIFTDVLSPPLQNMTLRSGRMPFIIRPSLHLLSLLLGAPRHLFARFWVFLLLQHPHFLQ